MSISYKNMVKVGLTAPPGTIDELAIGLPLTGYKGFTISDDIIFGANHHGSSFPVFTLKIEEGNNWEIRRNCGFQFSVSTMTRGFLVDSSTGSAINFTAAAVVSVVLANQFILPIELTTLSNKQVLQYNSSLGNWENKTLSTGSDIVSYSQAGGL